MSAEDELRRVADELRDLPRRLADSIGGGAQGWKEVHAVEYPTPAKRAAQQVPDEARFTAREPRDGGEGRRLRGTPDTKTEALENLGHAAAQLHPVLSVFGELASISHNVRAFKEAWGDLGKFTPRDIVPPATTAGSLVQPPGQFGLTAAPTPVEIPGPPLAGAKVVDSGLSFPEPTEPRRSQRKSATLDLTGEGTEAVETRLRSDVHADTGLDLFPPAATTPTGEVVRDTAAGGQASGGGLGSGVVEEKLDTIIGKFDDLLKLGAAALAANGRGGQPGSQRRYSAPSSGRQSNAPSLPSIEGVGGRQLSGGLKTALAGLFGVSV